MEENKFKSLFWIFLIILLFVVTSYLVQENLSYIESVIGKGFVGALIYILIVIIAVVVAPVSAVPLLPIISNTYGWILAGLLSIIGWTIGSSIAFILSRKYGAPLVEKIIRLDNIKKFEKMIPKENLFWSIVFLRMSVPVDILSYALGLFSHVKFRTYFFATLIGVTPFAFVFSYAGTINIYYQISALLAALIILLIGYFIVNKLK